MEKSSLTEDLDADLPLIVEQLLLEVEEHLAAGRVVDADDLLIQAELIAGIR